MLFVSGLPRLVTTPTIVELNTIARWIQPQHLKAEAMREYCSTFEAHPTRVLILDSFLREPLAEQMVQYLQQEAHFQTSYGVYSNKKAVAEEVWQRADETDRMYKFGLLVVPQLGDKLSPNELTFLLFRKLANTTQFKVFFETITGQSLGEVTATQVHSLRPGDYLRPHDDRSPNRQIAFILYLTPDWDARLGRAFRGTTTYQTSKRFA
jgi:hypothetical protein